MVAKTLTQILDNPDVREAMDRAKPVIHSIRRNKKLWSVDLEDLKPSPIYREGVDGEPIYSGTDLDMVSMFLPLIERSAVLDIPEYSNIRLTRRPSNELVVSKEHRHGEILGMVSREDSHSFNMQIYDAQVLQMTLRGSRVGSPRNFSVLQDDGTFNGRLPGFRWMITQEEKTYFHERGLESEEGRIGFRYFVHPNLASAFFGSPYLVLKILEKRLTEQGIFYKRVADDMEESGVKLPINGHSIDSFLVPEDVTYKKEGKEEQRKIKLLEARVIVPDFIGEYPIIGVENILPNDKLIGKRIYGEGEKAIPAGYHDRVKVLRYSRWASNKILNRERRDIRALSRAVELAFLKYGFRGEAQHGNEKFGNGKFPGWDIPGWQRNAQLKKRGWKQWNLLQYGPQVGIAYKIREASVGVRVY